MHGGILATLFAMFITWASGTLLSLSSTLGEAWAHVTPGQAALIIGALTYATPHARNMLRWLLHRMRHCHAG